MMSDVHHAILLPTALLKPDVKKLWTGVHTVEDANNVLLRTPIPYEMLSRAAEHGNQSITIRAIMDVVVLESIGSVLEDRPGIKAQVSQFAMYLRSHYLRMPMHLLLPHLLRKQFVSDAD